jgi:hypothetical protein
MHWRNWALWQYHFQHNQLDCRVLANDPAPRARPYTAFTVLGMGQFQWVTSPMGLLGCPASFQRLMETVINGLTNVIVYIDNLLIHSATHQEHITDLDKVLQKLVQHNIKINLQKCFFGSKEV